MALFEKKSEKPPAPEDPPMDDEKVTKAEKEKLEKEKSDKEKAEKEKLAAKEKDDEGNPADHKGFQSKAAYKATMAALEVLPVVRSNDDMGPPSRKPAEEALAKEKEKADSEAHFAEATVDADAPKTYDASKYEKLVKVRPRQHVKNMHVGGRVFNLIANRDNLVPEFVRLHLEEKQLLLAVFFFAVIPFFLAPHEQNQATPRLARQAGVHHEPCADRERHPLAGSIG